MRKMLLAGTVAVATLGVTTGLVSLASASAPSPDITHAKTLHLVSPIKGRITTPTSDLTTVMGPVTDRQGIRVGRLQEYCVTIEDKTGTSECTTTFFLSGSQITLTGPSYNRNVHSSFAQGVAAGTGHYQNVRGQATVTLRANQNVDFDISLLP